MYYLFYRINIVKSIIIVLLVLIAFEPAGAASLSIDIGKESTSFGIGTDFYFGYGLIGLSTKFTTDAPWSYVQTDETLIEQCEEFIDYKPPPDPDLTTNIEPERGCKPKGRFFDGDEWEIFGKIGYRLPLISRVYLNTGLGVSKQKSAELYLFSEEYCTYWNTNGTCTKAEYSETWGEVDEDYFMTFLGGISVEMNRRLLFNLDYHSRKGLIGGLMWRY